MSNYVLDGIMGLAVADALGVPVEFENRNILLQNPVKGMRAYGTYNRPAGTWSDDTSMTLCLVDSLMKGLDYHDIIQNFMKWFENGAYTPQGDVFDIGVATRKALLRYKKGISPLECGGKSEVDNGNGSLMRILPIVFHLQSVYGNEFHGKKEIFDVIHNVSSLTHAHTRSLIACGVYISVASNLLRGMDLEEAIESGIYEAMQYYRKQADFRLELSNFTRLEDKSFKSLPVHKIKSSGYVVDTLEAAIWCLLNTNDYETCVLKAVNLGEDTDTVAAVAGGLAGIAYGHESIPTEWKDTIVKKEYIEELCNQFYSAVTEEGGDINGNHRGTPHPDSLGGTL